MNRKILLMILLLGVMGILVFRFREESGSEKASSLTVLNYGDYIERDMLKVFEEETGIHVVYEEYETPETMYTKYKSKSISYDLICSAEYMIEKLISEDEVLEFDASRIPNLSFIDEKYYALVDAFDPGRRKTIPYFLGTVGILYNTKYVDSRDVRSWRALWNEKYRNQIIIENSVRDCLIPALRLNGESINCTEEDALSEALELLLDQKPLNYAYLSDDAMYEMIMENANLALIYSGEANASVLENENLAYEVPKEGSNLWIDAWFIPRSCQHKEEAEKFMNFLCDPEVAYANWDHVYYTTPNAGVYDMLDEEEREDETMFPSEEVLSRCEVFSALSDEDMRKYNLLWKKLKVGR